MSKPLFKTPTRNGTIVQVTNDGGFLYASENHIDYPLHYTRLTNTAYGYAFSVQDALEKAFNDNEPFPTYHDDFIVDGHDQYGSIN